MKRLYDLYRWVHKPVFSNSIGITGWDWRLRITGRSIIAIHPRTGLRVEFLVN